MGSRRDAGSGECKIDLLKSLKETFTWETSEGWSVARTTSMASWPTFPTETEGRSKVKPDRSGIVIPASNSMVGVCKILNLYMDLNRDL